MALVKLHSAPPCSASVSMPISWWERTRAGSQRQRRSRLSPALRGQRQATHALLKQARDDRRVHHLGLVHLADLWPDDVLGEALDCRGRAAARRRGMATRHRSEGGSSASALTSPGRQRSGQGRTRLAQHELLLREVEQRRRRRLGRLVEPRRRQGERARRSRREAWAGDGRRASCHRRPERAAGEDLGRASERGKQSAGEHAGVGVCEGVCEWV